MKPPVLKRGAFVLSGTMPIISYLANKFELRPKNEENNAKANMIVENCLDICKEC